MKGTLYQGLALETINLNGDRMQYMTGAYDRWSGMIEMAQDMLVSHNPGFQVEIVMVLRIANQEPERVRVWRGVSE